MAKEKGLLVRLETAEHEHILKRAQQFGISGSQFLCRLGMEKELPLPEDREIFLRIMYLIERSANNLNQIVKNQNADQKRGAAPTTAQKETLTAVLEARNLYSYMKKKVKLKWQS